MSDRETESSRNRVKHCSEPPKLSEQQFLPPLEGQLLKFTNVVKGFQYRWCIIDPETGVVHYYEKEEHKRSCKPRGTLRLTHASICPSDEDSQTFTIYSANGLMLKFKAVNARERQQWVNRLRVVAEFHTARTENNPSIVKLSNSAKTDSAEKIAAKQSLAQNLLELERINYNSAVPFVDSSSPLPSTSAMPRSIVDLTSGPGLTSPTAAKTNADSNMQAWINSQQSLVDGAYSPHSTEYSTQLRQVLRQLELETNSVALAVDSAPVCAPELTYVYKNLLLCKATSLAVFSSLKACAELLERRGQLTRTPVLSSPTNEVLPCQDGSFDHCADDTKRIQERQAVAFRPFSPDDSVCANFQLPIEGLEITASLPDPADDEDTEETDYDEKALGSVEEHKNVILHILSQLKWSMDLTKVTLPTFILEKKSLLEMFSDYMLHPDLFLRITTGRDAESRMLAFLEWYLTAFHAGRKDKIAKKPYNPIIGETFHCSWLVPPLQSEVLDGGSTETKPDTPVLLVYTAEQVSHHPPITAFRFACPSLHMQLSASIHTKSKAQGLSVCAEMNGRAILRLGNHDNEEYHFTLPSAYARSILTVPWVELGDKISVTCPKTGYSANVIFHTKPLYGNKLHRVSAEVFGPESAVSAKRAANVGAAAAVSAMLSGTTAPPTTVSPIARAQGLWNGAIDFERFTKGGRKWLLDVNNLPIRLKRVRPIAKQRPEESRRLWMSVTAALRAGDVNTATQHKHQLEDRQRASEKYRQTHRFAFPVKFFQFNPNDKSWVFCEPPSLKPGMEEKPEAPKEAGEAVTSKPADG